MTQTFQPSKKDRIAMIAAIAFFIAVPVFFLIVFFREKSSGKLCDCPVFLMCSMTGLFASLLLLLFYILAEYTFTQFSVAGSTVLVRSTLQNLEFDMLSIQAIRWKPAQRVIEFRAAGRRARLKLIFGRDDQLKIIRLVRTLVPEEKQEGWPIFCHRVALRLRDGIHPAEQTALETSDLPPSAFVVITRKRYNWLLYAGIPLSLAAMISISRVTGNLRIFAALPVVILLLLAPRYGVPPNGQRVLRLRATPVGPMALFVLTPVMVVLVLVRVLPTVLAMSRAEEALFEKILIAVIAPAILAMIYFVRKTDKAMKQRWAVGAASAIDRWERGESNPVS